MRDRTRRGTTDGSYCTCARQGGAQPPDGHAGQISRPTVAGRAGIGPAKRRRRPPWVTCIFLVFRPFQAISGHPIAPSRHFLDLLNSSTWSLSADFAPFGSYNEKEIGRSLDLVFRPPQRLLDQGNGTNEFLVSWAFH